MHGIFFIDSRPANDNALDGRSLSPARPARLHWLRARRQRDGAHVLVLVRGGFARPCAPANDDRPGAA